MKGTQVLGESAKTIFAERLKALRKSSGLTQEQLAKAMNYSTKGSISFYENCDRAPDIEFLSHVSKFFDVSADYLIGLTDLKTADTGIQTACAVTGLPEEAINFLASMNGNSKCRFRSDLPETRSGIMIIVSGA